MSRNLSLALFVAALIVVIVGVDLLFFRNQLWARLIVNIAIVAAFAALYFAFMERR